MTNYSAPNPPKSPKINQNMLIAIIGAVATIMAALIPWALGKFESQSTTPSPAPLVVTATVPVGETSASSSVSTDSTATPDSGAKTGIFDAYLASDEKGDFRTSSFSADQPIYLFFSIDDPANLNAVHTVWTAVDVPGYEPNKVIYESNNKATSPKFKILADRKDWKAGKYKVELSLNGTLDEKVEFEITK